MTNISPFLPFPSPRNHHVYLGLLPIFLLGCLFCCFWAANSFCAFCAFCAFWRLSHFCIVCNYFLPYCRLFFHFVYVCCTKTCFIRSHLLVFAFISIALGDWPKKTLVWFMSENVLLIFSSSFMVSCLIFVYINYW